jgi:DNA polymerase III delta prime subunit
MNLACPPPHMLFHEPLDDREMIRVWKEYTEKHQDMLDPHEIDAASVCSVDEFGKLFEIWVTSKSTKRVKLLMVWHAHFLSLACQQSLRRWLETKSYRSRVWFHVEYMNNIQSAIQSRCISRVIKAAPHIVSPTHIGDTKRIVDVWKQIKTDAASRVIQ